MMVRAAPHTNTFYQLMDALYNMVPRGLEPQTLRLLAVRSNQLSYETNWILLGCRSISAPTRGRVEAASIWKRDVQLQARSVGILLLIREESFTPPLPCKQCAGDPRVGF